MASFTPSVAGTATALNYHSVTFAQDIKRKFRLGLELENLLPTVPSDGEYFVSTTSDIGEVIQPYQGGFTPKGSVSFDEVSTRIRPLKIDLRFDEAQLATFQNKWMYSKWFDPTKPDLYTFAQYVIEQEIMPKWQEELNDLSYNGVYAAPTTGTAGAYIGSVDGFKTVIAAAIAATTLTPLASGTFTSSNILTKVVTWCQAMPEVFRNKKGKILMSATNARYFEAAYMAAYGASFGLGLGANGEPDTTRNRRVPGFNIYIEAVSAMEGSARWIFVPETSQNNMSVFTRQGYPAYPSFKFTPEPRSVAVEGTIYRGFGFQDWRTLLVNDQA